MYTYNIHTFSDLDFAYAQFACSQQLQPPFAVAFSCLNHYIILSLEDVS